MPWERSFATHAADADDFATFRCCDRDTTTPWIAEVEDYVRVSALRHAIHIVAFRDEARGLVAVSAFDPVTIELPRCSPIETPGWKLQVVAICLQHQAQGRSEEVFQQTYDAMREVNPDRALVTARVHREHQASRAAAERAGLTLLMTGDDYHTVLGEVPK